jgi:hypothetical protein
MERFENYISSPEPTCKIELQKEGVKIDRIGVGEGFDIVITDYSGDIEQVRFLSDESQNGKVDEGFTWTDWYDWNTSKEDWTGHWYASNKTKTWAFATPGEKEVWGEVIDSEGRTAKSYAGIYVIAPPMIGYKGIWINHIWEVEGGNDNLDKIISRLKSANVTWVMIKCGDNNSYWLEEDRKLFNWTKRYGGFEKVIDRFHNNGIKVFGAHWVQSLDGWHIPGVSAIDVSNKILNIKGIDGLIVDAENDTKAGVENYKSYIKSIREMHKNTFIGHTSYARADEYREELHELFTEYCDVIMPQAYWQHRPTTPAEEIDKMEEEIGELRDKWNNKPIIPMGQGYYYDHDSKKEEKISDETAEEMAKGISEFCEILEDKGYLGVSLFTYETMHWKTWEAYAKCFAPAPAVFDTGSPPNPYPSIMGKHTGTIKPNHTIIATQLYTYPCSGTGSHTEYARIWNKTWNATATWNGYADEWHNITFDKTVILMANKTYNYTIRTGSYPQIHHNTSLLTANGWINCLQFVDANGEIYYDWIPAIKLFL